MVKEIIESELREQAGSDSYKRFEYQVHWAVYYMIKQLKVHSNFYVFCEFMMILQKWSFLIILSVLSFLC
ncbi:dsDNA nuclease domain-containing protein [Bacillus atrophaeus]|uniref:dsDNA nuclease domain-containing protein n=1 Tax=Bacillus atrophaeus TaxID=1452 RepID=UPI001C117EBF|nr:DUF4297 domain-containing protein [Bacillus atrophaeus]